MKTCLIVNSCAGSWDQCREKLNDLAAASGVPVFSETQQRPLARILADARRQDFRRLIVAGGDGTLSRIANAASRHLQKWEFGLIPTGTGNDLARSIGIQGAPLEDAWNWALTRPSVAIDVIKATDGGSHFIVNAATAGFGGMVSTDVTSEEKHRWGPVAYWMTAFSRLAALDSFDIRLELDTETLSLTAYGLCIANGRYVGGGFPVASNAVVNDGLLDITTVPDLPALELIAAGLDFALGREQYSDGVRTHRSSRVQIHADPILPYSLDGEPTRSIDATFEVIPNHLRIACGPNAVALQADAERGQVVA